MAAKGRTKQKKTKEAKKTLSKAKPRGKPEPKKQKVRYAKPTVDAKGRKVTCCVHCQDYKFCNDRGACCEYCDFLVKGKCTYRRNKEVLTADKEKIEIGDYRGDDYGIDDYEEYEEMFE